MHLLLFDEAFLGHHAIWMEESLRAVRQIAPHVEVSYAFPYAFDDSKGHIEWKEPARHHLLRKLQALTGRPWLAAEKWRGLKRLVRKTRADRVVMLFADEFLHPGYVPQVAFEWVPVYFHPRFLRGDSMKPPLTALRAPSCPFVYVLDEGIRRHLSQLIGKPVVKIPDFCPTDCGSDTPRCDTLRLAAAGRPIIGAIGPVTRHKNIGRLIEVAKRHPEWHFLIAGLAFPKALSDAEGKRVEEAGRMENVTCFLEYLPHEELNTLTAMCAVQFAAYNRFLHSSNKLVRACIYRTPLVVANAGCMGEMVTQHRMGTTCDPTSIDSIEAAIARALGIDHTAADWEGYLASNSMDSLRRAVTPLVAEDIGRAAKALSSDSAMAKEEAK
jgi:glycosyltransferase involved in cell wall biosynthesis